jgi:MFS transporter, DHA3 family, multidrug efflux protein
MKTFYLVLSNSLLATLTNFFVWFSAIYWAYLETQSVISTSIVGGVFLVTTALSGFWLGSIVDHNKKKTAMLISSAATLVFFVAGLLLYSAAPDDAFKYVSSPWLWGMVILILFGAIAGNIRGIAMPTLVTILVPEDRRDKANGLSGTVMGIAFAGANVVSGLVLAFAGMFWVLASAIILTVLVTIHLALISISEKGVIQSSGPAQGDPAPSAAPTKGKLDIKGTIAAIRDVPGLFGLIFFTTFNNFLGGVFMALMDAYGLSLVSLQVWGTLWGFLSLGFIFGGLWIAKKGLGSVPLRTLFRVNIVLWAICILFPIQPSIVILAICMAVYVALIPFIEATEQTIVQKVVPLERQGRVFGFAQSVEQAASPITAFLIGPIAQYLFIPFMTTGRGVELIGGWFGTGAGRGLALVFILVGIIGLIITLLARQTRSYKLLSARYLAPTPGVAPQELNKDTSHA